MHLYTHIPFCERKCAYCGFYSIRAARDRILAFPRLLFREFCLAEARFPDTDFRPETWYIGGGTPSLLGAEGFSLLARLFSSRFPLSSLREWTVELNPASAGEGLLRAMRRAGVTRLSLGAQSFNDAALRRAGRPHTAADILEALRRMRTAGFEDIGIDLIAGLPGDDAGSWAATLETAAGLGLRHVSVYALTVEPGTRFFLDEKRGRLPPRDDGDLLARLAEAERVLSAAGFERYEISNYARPGFACRHNLAVWRGEDYLGLGPAAASRIGRERWTRAPDLAAYERALRGGGRPPDAASDTLDETEDAVERAIFRLRLNEGLDFRDAARRFPALRPLLPAWRGILAALAPRGLTVPASGGWRLTARGREVCDAILRELAGA